VYTIFKPYVELIHFVLNRGNTQILFQDVMPIWHWMSIIAP